MTKICVKIFVFKLPLNCFIVNKKKMINFLVDFMDEYLFFINLFYRNLNNVLKKYLLEDYNQKQLMINYVITSANLERFVMIFFLNAFKQYPLTVTLFDIRN